MKTKAEKDILKEYRDADAEGRLDIMLGNYCTFPKLIRKLERKTHYKIKCEKEHLKSRARAELGVRIQNSKISKPTEEEAELNRMIEEAFETGEIDGSVLKGISNAAEYEADILTISIMRMDFELLEDFIEALEDEDVECLRAFLRKQKFIKELAADRGKTYEAMKKRMDRLRESIRDEIIDCLEMNCRGGEEDA